MLRIWSYLTALVVLLLLFHRARKVFWLFSVLVLPGTCAHEACHLALGLLLGGRPSGFNLLPRRNERGWELGSVSFRRITWYNAFFIGVAPLLLLPAAYALARWRLDGALALGWRELLILYLIANLAYAALPSWQDLKIAARSPIGWLLLAGAAVWGWRQVIPPAPAPSPHGSSASGTPGAAVPGTARP